MSLPLSVMHPVSPERGRVVFRPVAVPTLPGRSGSIPPIPAGPPAPMPGPIRVNFCFCISIQYAVLSNHSRPIVKIPGKNPPIPLERGQFSKADPPRGDGRQKPEIPPFLASRRRETPSKHATIQGIAHIIGSRIDNIIDDFPASLQTCICFGVLLYTVMTAGAKIAAKIARGWCARPLARGARNMGRQRRTRQRRTRRRACKGRKAYLPGWMERSH